MGMMRTKHCIVFGLALLLALLAATPASAAPRQRCFNETGYCVADPLLSYWERNGGLAVFGYPIGALHDETNQDGWTGPTQWFERDRLENHGNERAGVLAGRLGVEHLRYAGRPWEKLPRVDRSPGGDCRYFVITNHSLCGTFRRYWERNGGLERFGYPVSEAMHETLPGFSGQVQYFERRRMEYHPELAGTRYEVLLGLLGSELIDPFACKFGIGELAKTAAAYPDAFGCPAPFPQYNARMATQPFERGAMTWVEGLDGGMGHIWVVYYDNTRGSLVWQNFPDTWTEGQPVSGGEGAPAGLYEPIRGFGKLWRENAAVRNTLGWAVAPETAEIGHLQYFRGGAWMVYRSTPDRVYLMYVDNRADDFARIK